MLYEEICERLPRNGKICEYAHQTMSGDFKCTLYSTYEETVYCENDGSCEDEEMVLALSDVRQALKKLKFGLDETLIKGILVKELTAYYEDLELVNKIFRALSQKADTLITLEERK